MFVLLLSLVLPHSHQIAYGANLHGKPVPVSASLAPGKEVFAPDIESLAVGTVNSFRPQSVSGDLSSGKISASHAARNLLVSIVLLIGVFVAGNFTLRQSLDPGKSYRQCPFAVYLPGFSERPAVVPSKYEGDGIQDGMSLSEAVGVDWDKVPISDKFSCVFDPTSLPIDNLMSLPPPSFKSKVDIGLDHHRNLFTPASNEYVSIICE